MLDARRLKYSRRCIEFQARVGPKQQTAMAQVMSRPSPNQGSGCTRMQSEGPSPKTVTWPEQAQLESVRLFRKVRAYLVGRVLCILFVCCEVI